MMTRDQKTALITKFSKDLETSKATFLFDFKGLKVEEVTRLRKSLSSTQAQVQIIKNTLAARALKDHPDMESILVSSLKGPNAFLFARDQVHQSLREFFGFKKSNEQSLLIKKAFMHGHGEVSAHQAHSWSQLPSENVLRQKFLSVLQAPLQSFARVLQATMVSFVRILKAQKEEKEKEQP